MVCTFRCGPVLLWRQQERCPQRSDPHLMPLSTEKTAQGKCMEEQTGDKGKRMDAEHLSVFSQEHRGQARLDFGVCSQEALS